MFDLSIVLPTRNRADQLLKALMGIERATHCPYELIVIDGASTDSTGDVLMLAGSIMGSRLRVVREGTPVGFAAACNKGVAIARGRNLCVLHDDVHPLDGALDRAVQQLDDAADDRDVVALFTRPDGEMSVAVTRTDAGRPYAVAHVGGTLVAEYPLARRRAFVATPFDASLQSSAAAIDFSLNLWQSGHRIVPALHSTLDAHFVAGPADPISHAELETIRERWGLNRVTAAFDPAVPCTLAAPAERRRAA